MEQLDDSAPSTNHATVRFAQPSTPPSAVIKLLDQWMTEDPAEQQETFELLRQALDERRAAQFKLFP